MDSTIETLRDYGYTDYFKNAFRSLEADNLVPARVIEQRRGGYRILSADESGLPLEGDAVASAALSRLARSAAEMPAVGDWVAAERGAGGNSVPGSGPSLIRALLPRATAFIRKAPGDALHDRIDAQVVAANVDSAFIVAAAGRDWNPRRVERYVALAHASGARPVLVLAKADLAAQPEALLREAETAAPGVRTAMVCALDGRGLDELSFALTSGETVVLLGSSGAGKSTLLNALAGRELARTSEVREDDQRGRHTTTHRQLFRLPSGALVIDTPGMRELQLWADGAAVDSAFPEIEELAEYCRFRDCRHEAEPGCAVRAALETGGLDEGRFESWRKLAKEAAFLKTKEDRSAKEAERRRWKSIEMSRRSFAKSQRETKRG